MANKLGISYTAPLTIELVESLFRDHAVELTLRDGVEPFDKFRFPNWDGFVILMEGSYT